MDHNQFNKFQEYGLLANQMSNQMKTKKYTQSELPKQIQNPIPLYDSKEHLPLFPMDMGSESTNLYYKAQQMIDKDKESPSKSVSSSNIGT